MCAGPTRGWRGHTCICVRVPNGVFVVFSKWGELSTPTAHTTLTEQSQIPFSLYARLEDSIGGKHPNIAGRIYWWPFDPFHLFLKYIYMHVQSLALCSCLHVFILYPRSSWYSIFSWNTQKGCSASVLCTVEVDSSPPLENTTETPLGTRTQKHVCPLHPHVGLARKLFAEDKYLHGIHTKRLFCQCFVYCRSR